MEQLSETTARVDHGARTVDERREQQLLDAAAAAAMMNAPHAPAVLQEARIAELERRVAALEAEVTKGRALACDDEPPKRRAG